MLRKRVVPLVVLIATAPLFADDLERINLKGKFLPTYTDPKKAEQVSEYPVVGTTILFVADNQKALVTAEPIVEQGALVEKTVNTAHRRAALDSFSLDVVQYMASQNQEIDLLVHGGDILNNSCSWEFMEFVKAIRALNIPWFVAPGNHDGYFLGITSPLSLTKRIYLPGNGPLDERGGWAQACTSMVTKREEHDGASFRSIETYGIYEENVVDKVAYIGKYLDGIGLGDSSDWTTDVYSRDEDFTEAFAGYESYSLECLNFEESEGGLHNQFLREVCWTRKKGEYDFLNKFYSDKAQYGYGGINLAEQWEDPHPWRNFIVQVLEVSAGYEKYDILIVDTSSYSPGIALTESGWMTDIPRYGAADTAHISEPQWNIIQKMIKPGRTTVVVGHHPLLDMDIASYQKIVELFSRHGAVRYVSGDTHSGYDVCFTDGSKPSGPGETCNEQYPIIESNLGSTIDAPLEYAIGGYYDDRFYVRRKSLTPLRKLDDGVPGTDYKRAGAPINLPKIYASFDGDMWESKCAAYARDGRYKPNDKGYDPFNQGEVSELIQYTFKKTPTMAYLRHPRDVYFIDMYVYKIDRLIWLAEIYEKVYERANKPLSKTASTRKKNAEDSLEHLQRLKNRPIGSPDKDDYYWGMLQMAYLVEELEKDLPSSEDISEFRVCSALYEAENEFD